MGQITEAFARTMLEQCARKEHPSLTVWEAEQLARAWLRLAEKEMDSFALNAVRNALNRGASIRSRDLSKPVLTKVDERTIYGGLDINLPPENLGLGGVLFYPLQEQRGESSAIDAARAADSEGGSYDAE